MYSSLASALHRHGKLTCHMGSHSDTCHPTEVRIPPLLPAEAGTRFSDPGGMQGWVDLCYVKATGWKLYPRPANHKSNALPLSHHATSDNILEVMQDRRIVEGDLIGILRRSLPRFSDGLRRRSAEHFSSTAACLGYLAHNRYRTVTPTTLQHENDDATSFYFRSTPL